MSDPAALVPLVPLAIPLFGIHPIVVLREGVAGIDTLLAVVADAGAIVGMPTLGECGPRGGRGEQSSKEKFLHAGSSEVRIPHRQIKRRERIAVKRVKVEVMP